MGGEVCPGEVAGFQAIKFPQSGCDCNIRRCFIESEGDPFRSALSVWTLLSVSVSIFLVLLSRLVIL